MAVFTTRVYRKLRSPDLPEVRRHLLGLSAEDRYLRFHQRMGDAEVMRYCSGINWFTGVLIGCFIEGRLCGMVEIGFSRSIPPSTGEASLSVERAWQQYGIGLTLLQRARTVAANRGLRRLVLYYLAENTRIIRMIRSFGGAIDYTEKLGVVPVEPPSVVTLSSEAADEISAFVQAWFGAPRFPWPPDVEPSFAWRSHAATPPQPAAAGE